MATGSDPFGWLGVVVDGKYRVEEVVGEGGFGVVYRATHVTLGDTVAVKCLKVPSGLDEGARQRFRASFLEEGRLLRRLSRATTGIVQALDAGDAVSPTGAWTPYLVLEWLDGHGLDDEPPRPRALEEVLALLAPAADALATAHAEGVSHRDVKPANLFLTTMGGRKALKVLDFGIAKVMTGDPTLTAALRATGGSMSAFTPAYGAPEQFAKHVGATGPWTDVFALALVFVELWTGRMALDGDDVAQLYVASTDPTRRPTPGARGAMAPPGVEAVFATALAVSPEARYRTMGAFWAALTQAAVEAGVPVPSAPGASAPRASLPSLAHTVPAAPMGIGLPAQNPSTTHSPVVAGGATVPTMPSPARPPPQPSGSPAMGALLLLGVTAVIALGAILVGGVVYRRHLADATSAPASASSLEPTRVTPVEVAMVRLGPATFFMGSDSGGPAERPRHMVRITHPFRLDETEVTVGQYKACVAAKHCTVPTAHGPGMTEPQRKKDEALCTYATPGGDDLPVNCIDRQQADAVCRFAGKRLPTEAEWELAASGGEGRRYPWGDLAPTCAHGNFGEASGQRCEGRPVAVRGSPLGKARGGALDLAGNVWEWVDDGWDPKAYVAAGRTDPRVPPGERGVLRGGAWDFSASAATASYRYELTAGTGHPSTGVRCAKDAD